MSRIVTERIDADHLSSLEREWRELASRCLDVPFLSWEWVAGWIRHFPEQRVAIRDEPYLLAFRTEAGTLVGAAALMITHRPRAGGIRVLDFIGADPNVTEYRGILSLPEHELSVWVAFLAEAKRLRSQWDWMYLRGVPSTGQVREHLEGRGDVRWVRETTAFVVPLAPSWDELRQRLPRNTKEAIRRCYNALAREGIACTLELARRPEEVPEALERFFRLHAARAGRNDTVQHPDVFRSPSARAFLSDVCGTFAEAGALRIFQLRIGADIVATRIGFVVGDTLYLYFSGYDPAWGDYHVMTRALVEAIRSSIEEGRRFVHLSMGRDQSKLRWRPQETTFHDGVLLGTSLRSRVARGAFELVDPSGAESAERRAPLRRLVLLARSFLGRRAARRGEPEQPSGAIPAPSAVTATVTEEPE